MSLHITQLAHCLEKNSPILNHLQGVAPEKWAKTLKKNDKSQKLLVDLFEATVRFREKNQTHTFKEINKECKKIVEKSISKKKIDKKIQKKFQEAYALHQQVKEIEKNKIYGIQNLGATCWLNSLLELFRTTNDFESILEGEVHHALSDDERQHLVELQNALRKAVNELRDPQYKGLKEKRILKILECLYRCNFIAIENGEGLEKKELTKKLATTQFDATEILTKLLSRLGKAPEEVNIERVKRYSDNSEEIQKKLEQSAFLPLFTAHAGNTISQLLNDYFGQEEGRTVKFQAKTAQGALLNTYDGSIGRTGTPSPIFTLIGKQATRREQYRAQLEYIQKKYSKEKACKVTPEYNERILIGFTVERDGKKIAELSHDFGITDENPKVLDFLGRKKGDENVDLIYEAQKEYIKTLHPQAEGAIQVDCVKMVSMQRKIRSLPPLLQLRVNSLPGVQPIIESKIDLKNYLQPDAQIASSQYELTAVICRSGAQTNGSGGHFWFFKKENDTWTRYDDSRAKANLTKKEIQSELNENGYALFYSQKSLA